MGTGGGTLTLSSGDPLDLEEELHDITVFDGVVLAFGSEQTEVVELLKEQGIETVKVFMGGVIPPNHIPILKEKGIHEVFGPDTPMQTIIDGIYSAVSERG